MALRVLLTLTWTYARDMVAGPWNQDADFEALARRELDIPFARYNSALAFTVTQREGRISHATILFEVDLDMIEGAWHQPEDYANEAYKALHEAMPDYSLAFTATIQRFPQPDDVDGATGLVPWDADYRARDFAAWKTRLKTLDAA